MKKYIYSMLFSLLLCSVPAYAGFVASASIYKLNSSSKNYKPYAASSRDNSNDKYFTYNMSTLTLGGGYAFSLNDAQTWFLMPTLELGVSLADYEVKQINEQSAVSTTLKDYVYTNQFSSVLMSEFQYRPQNTDLFILGGLQVLYQSNHVDVTDTKASDSFEEDLHVTSLGWYAGLGYSIYWGLVVSGHVGAAFNREAEIATAALRLHYLF